MPRPEQTVHSFFFLSVLLAKVGSGWFGWSLLVFALKKTVSMPARTLTQLAVCIQTLIALGCVWQASSRMCTRQQKYDGGCEDAQESLLKAATQQSPGD